MLSYRRRLTAKLTSAANHMKKPSLENFIARQGIASSSLPHTVSPSCTQCVVRIHKVAITKHTNKETSFYNHLP